MTSCYRLENGINKETVLVTGFGPFGVHKSNASWEAVKELAKIGINGDVNLVIEQIEVVYEHVDQLIPELWRKYKPRLVVHCGVSGVAHHMTLEQRGHKNGYISLDERGKAPEQKVCPCSAKDCIVSNLQMGTVCEAVNSSGCGVTAIVSHDAGRYLCDYTYFSSLAINPNRTAFIHVPPLENPYTAEQLAQAIRIAILNMLEQCDGNVIEQSQL